MISPIICFAITRKFNLSVNISGAALEDESIREKISQIINFYNLPKHQLHLEITETSMMENVERCANILYEWKNAGTDIWIDDFGTGYSSLNYLHNLPIDGLKVDRSFISSISTHQQSQIIETIVALGSSLDIKTIAEGIENEIYNGIAFTIWVAVTDRETCFPSLCHYAH